MNFKRSLTEMVVEFWGDPLRDDDVPRWRCRWCADDSSHFVVLPATERYPKERYKCRRCGETGDVCDFVMRVKEWSFERAAAHLGRIDADTPQEPSGPRVVMGILADGEIPLYYATCSADPDTIEVKQGSHHLTMQDVRQKTKRWRIWESKFPMFVVRLHRRSRTSLSSVG